MGTFERGAVRRAMESQPFELPTGDEKDIRRALRAMARSRPVSYRPPRALELLQTGTGIADATFRPGQEEAVRHVVEGRGRLLVVERTGWGKSFVYFIATRLLREGGRGPALLVSPLLSLMRNQIEAARRMGVHAAMITSANSDDWPKVEAALDRDEVDILLIAPERFANEHFRTKVLLGIADRVSLLVIDECHCISDWGHDFRPDYQRIERAARNLPRNMRLLATTATANDRVMKDLRNVLGRDLKIQRGPLARPSLALQTIRLPRQSQRLAWLAEQLPVRLDHGHMEFLIGALDGDPEGIVSPRLPPLPAEISPQTEREAQRYLRRLDLPIPPRLKWPAGGLSHVAVESKIPEEHRAETGRALCLWGDAGSGEMVKRGKQKDGRFADKLVDEGASLVWRWGPDPPLQWVTCIPSRENPSLVPDFAERLARMLGLPFRPVLVKTADRRPQKEMENSVQQARNVDGSLAVSAPQVPPTPVLLVDDVVGSRWTFTVAAWLLRLNGSGRVWPLALSALGRGS